MYVNFSNSSKCSSGQHIRISSVGHNLNVDTLLGVEDIVDVKQ